MLFIINGTAIKWLILKEWRNRLGYNEENVFVIKEIEGQCLNVWPFIDRWFTGPETFLFFFFFFMNCFSSIRSLLLLVVLFVSQKIRVAETLCWCFGGLTWPLTALRSWFVIIVEDSVIDWNSWNIYWL